MAVAATTPTAHADVAGGPPTNHLRRRRTHDGARAVSERRPIRPSAMLRRRSPANWRKPTRRAPPTECLFCPRRRRPTGPTLTSPPRSDGWWARNTAEIHATVGQMAASDPALTDACFCKSRRLVPSGRQGPSRATRSGSARVSLWRLPCATTTSTCSAKPTPSSSHGTACRPSPILVFWPLARVPSARCRSCLLNSCEDPNTHCEGPRRVGR